MRSPNIPYLAGIDHLRAVAAVLIVFYHGVQLFALQRLYGYRPDDAWLRAKNPLAALVVEGHTAVGLFMVLSGFIFAYGNRRHDIHWGGFLTNRVLRIAPLTVVMLAVGAYAFPQGVTLAGLLQHALLLSNLRSAPALGPFGLMLWTIAVEFQFYLIFPFLLRFLRERGPRYGAGVIVLALTLRGLAVIHGASARDLSYWSLVGRIDQFVLGMMLGLYHRPLPLANGRQRVAACAATLGAVMVALYYFHRAGGNPVEAQWKVLWPMAEGLLWTAFVATYLDFARHVPARLSTVLCRVGELSFSAYLLHRVIIDAQVRHGWLIPTPARWGLLGDALNVVLIALPATLALSCLTYAVVEKPFLEMRVRYRRERPAETPRLAA